MVCSIFFHLQYLEKSDIWALGCVLYELCTLGRLPFQATNQGALILRILNGRFEPISRVYSGELSEIIKGCLTRDASSRLDLLRIFSRPVVQAKALAFGMALPVPKVQIESRRRSIEGEGPQTFRDFERPDMHEPEVRSSPSTARGDAKAGASLWRKRRDVTGGCSRMCYKPHLTASLNEQQLSSHLRTLDVDDRSREHSVAHSRPPPHPGLLSPEGRRGVM
jgi:serine/threonine protein kinase